MRWMGCFPGTGYFLWVEHEPFKKWFWRHLFLLGSVANSVQFQLKVYKDVNRSQGSVLNLAWSSSQ